MLNEAQRAKAELGVSSDGLKFDPAADIKKHYKKLKKNSYDPVLPMYQRVNIIFLDEFLKCCSFCDSSRICPLFLRP